jgi:hypothetical protein
MFINLCYGSFMEYERRPSKELDAIALASMQLRNHDEILAYRTDGGIDVMRFIETGETTLQTYKMRGETVSFEVAVKEPIVDSSYDTLESYTGPQSSIIEAPNLTQPKTKPEQDPQYVMELNAIITKAYEQSEALIDSDRFQACERDCEDGTTIGRCWCTHGGSSYTDLDGETVKNREVGVADPECEECEGAGQHAFRCYECKGAGHVLINPFITAINNQTSEEVGFRLEVTRLITDGAVSLGVDDEPRQFTRSSVPLPPQRKITLDLSDLARNMALKIGIDIDNEQYYTYWGKDPIETWATTFGHLLRPMVVDVPRPDQFDSLEAYSKATLQSLQLRVVQALRKDMYGIDFQKANPSEMQTHAKTFDLEMSEDLTVRKFGMRLDKAGSPHGNLQELINILSLYDYRLGFTHTGIATGETGPALYILDKAGNILSEIDSGYSESLVLENACRRIREAHLKGEIQPSD